MWLIVSFAGGTMLLLAAAMSWILGWANRAFHVEVNPLVSQAMAILPGANCGACGYVGCSEYAEAVAENGEDVNKCPVGGSGTAEALADIMGVEVGESLPYRPVVHCNATSVQRLGGAPYQGEPTCTAANLVAGVQGCTYGCLGFGDCVTACPFDAIHVCDGLAVVDYQKCTGCSACQSACPRHIIHMVPFKAERMTVIKCSNKDFGKDVKNVCTTGCIGCKVCSKLGGDVFEMDGNLPKVDFDSYDPQQMEAVDKAAEKCPMKGIVEVGRPSEKELAAVADEELPDTVTDEFATSVDNTEWRG
ncbi:MAG: RnfABCDGE type electron transport complex subunit B [Planctomycetota bacterium]